MANEVGVTLYSDTPPGEALGEEYWKQRYENPTGFNTNFANEVNALLKEAESSTTTVARPVGPVLTDEQIKGFAKQIGDVLSSSQQSQLASRLASIQRTKNIQGLMAQMQLERQKATQPVGYGWIYGLGAVAVFGLVGYAIYRTRKGR